MDLLKAVLEREAKRSCTCQHLVPGDDSIVEEVIAMLEERIDYDPTPNEIGEPPITLDEMHTAAWEQHQEMRR